MTYKIVSAENESTLEDLVNEEISKGFEPIGGVSVVYCQWTNERKGYTESSWCYTQALIKRKVTK